MPRDNHVWVRGRLAADPHFEVLDGKTPHIRFNLIVARDNTQLGRGALAPASPPKAKADRCDLLRVAVYGERAALEYAYLRKGAEVGISGWSEARRYYDKRAARWRLVQEINAQGLMFGRGCDFVRGDAHRQRKLEEVSEQERSQLEALGLAPVDMLPDGAEFELEEAL